MEILGIIIMERNYFKKIMVALYGYSDAITN